MALSKNVYQTFLTQVPVQLLGIVSGVLIARLLGPEGKGAYAVYHANVQLLVTVFSFSFHNGLVYFLSSRKIDPEKLLGLGIIVVLIGTVLLTGVVLITLFPLVGNVFLPEAFSSKIYLVWMGLFGYISLANTLLSGFFQGYKRFDVVNKVAFTNSIISLLLVLVLFQADKYFFMHVDLIHVLVALGLAILFNHFQFLSRFLREFNIRPVFVFSINDELRPLFRYLLPAHLSIFINFFNYRFNLWVLNYHLDETTIGLYSLAGNLTSFFSLVTMPISNVLMPYLASESPAVKNELFSRYSRLNFTLILLGVLVAFVLARPVIPWVYGLEYQSSVDYFVWLLPGVLLSCQVKIIAVFIIACGKQIYNLWATVAGLFFAVFLNLWLIPHLGGYGAVAASVFTNMAIFIVVWFAAHLKLGLPFNNHYFLTLKDIKQMMNDAGSK